MVQRVLHAVTATRNGAAPRVSGLIKIWAMDIGSLLQEHIYPAIVLGSLLEGETTVVLAGYAAHQGYAPLWAVMALTAGINFLLDLTWFALGRWRGPQLMLRFPALRRGVDVVTPRLHRHRRKAIFMVRFLYGLRTAGPIALGMARVPAREFMVFNALGASVWAVLFASLGFVFGRAISVFLGQLAHYEELAAAVIIVGGLCVLLWRYHRRRVHPRVP
jgi:membrane protein DedA with SNARE-associated domain